MMKLIFKLLICLLPVLAFADDQPPTPEKLTPTQVQDSKQKWHKQDRANKVRLRNRLLRAKANNRALRAAPGTPLKRPYYGDNAGNPVMHHH